MLDDRKRGREDTSKGDARVALVLSVSRVDIHPGACVRDLSDAAYLKCRHTLMVTPPEI